MFRAVFVAVSVSLPIGAFAQDLSISGLELQCSPALLTKESMSREQKIAAIDCMNYLGGIWDGLSLASAETGKKLFCPPVGGVSRMDMARLFLAASVSAPASVRRTPNAAPALFLLGLQSKYPC